MSLAKGPGEPVVGRLFRIFVLTLAIAGAFPAAAAPQSGQPPPIALRVAVTGSEPFVLQTDSGPGGLSVDVWRAVASRLGLESEFLSVDDTEAALDQLAAGEVDVVVGPVSITADRATRVRFTQPYFNSSLAILAAPADSLFDRFAPFASRTFIAGVVALAAVLCLVGTLLWLAERGSNPAHFPATGISGVGNGIWMALVTMTTVGYGDRVPVSLAGRFLTGVWMLVSLVIASSLTAFLATALTLSQMTGPSINTVEDVRGAPVAVVAGTTSESFAAQSGARPVAFPDLASGVAAMEQGRAQAVIFDRPMLGYLLLQRPELQFRLSDASYQPQNYGFAVGIGSTMIDEINLAILQLQGEGAIQQIEQNWLGR